MTTNRDIINDAYREAGITGLDENPEASMLEEALRRLNTLYKSLFGTELGEPLTSVNYGQSGLTNNFAKNEDRSSDINSTFVPSNSRIVLNIGAATTLFLPPNPRDGARFGIIDNGGNLATYNLTVNANGRKIESANSLVLNTNLVNREWFYRADLGSWTRIIDIVVDDPAPLPLEFDDLLTTMLAIRVNPRHGATTSDEMVEALKRIRRIFRARYRQVSEQNSEAGLYRLTSNPWYLFDNVDFNHG